MIEKQLKSLITNSGKSLNAIAKGAGVDYATLHRFVNDGRKVQITFVESLCKFFGLELGCTDTQLKSLLRQLTADALRQSGKQFKHRNGRLDSESLRNHLESCGDLDAETDDPIRNLAASRFNELNDTKRKQLISETVSSINFSDAMYQSNQKWLHELDQAIPELRDAYNSMNAGRRKILREYLALIVKAESLEKKLSGPHEFTLSSSVGHEYHDEDGTPVDGHWVNIKPKIMLAAVEAWDKDEEFTPKSFREFI